MADNVTNNKIVTTVELDVNLAAQEIVKLNSLASDSTQELSSRLDAKNKQIEIQNQLNKKTISDLEKEVKGLKGVEGAEKDLIRAQKKLEKAKLNEVKVTERNAKQQRKLADSYKKSKGAVNKLDKATGGMITRLKLLAANPIVLFVTLLVGALTLLQKAFVSSEDGQNKWNKAMAVVDALLGNLLDLVADLANVLVDLFSNPRESIESFSKLIKENITNRFEGLMDLIPQLGQAISLLFEGEFTAAGKVAGNAVAKVALGVEDFTGKIEKAIDKVKEFGAEQVKEAGLAAQVADKRAKADLIDRKLVVERSKLESKIAENRLKARKEEEFTAAQRKEFLLEAQELEDQLIDKETESLELRRDAQILENTFSRSNKENLDKEAEAIAAVNNQQAIRARKAKKLQNELNTVSKQLETEQLKKEKDAKAKKDKEDAEAEAKKKEKKEKELAEAEADRVAQNELDEIEIQRKRSVGERTLELELELLERKRLQDVSMAGLTAKEIEVINKKSFDQKQKINKASEKAEMAKDKAILNSALNMAGEAFGISQELATAEMIIAAPKAVGEVWKQAATKKTIPGMIAHGVIGTATVVAPIVKGLASIKKARFPKSKKPTRGGGGSISVPSAPTGVGTSNITDLSANNASRSGTNSSISDNATAAALRNTTSSRGIGNVAFYEGSYQEFRNSIDFRENHSTI